MGSSNTPWHTSCNGNRDKHRPFGPLVHLRLYYFFSIILPIFFLSFSLSKQCYLILQDECCGVINYADWRNTIYGGHRYDKVPDSCCLEQKHACGFEFELSKIKRQVRYSIVVMWIVTWLNIMNFFPFVFFIAFIFSFILLFVLFSFIRFVVPCATEGVSSAIISFCKPSIFQSQSPVLRIRIPFLGSSINGRRIS